VQSTSSRELIELSNTSELPINWCLDPERFFGSSKPSLDGIREEAEDREDVTTSADKTNKVATSSSTQGSELFQFTEHRGILQPGEAKQLSVSFNPITTGRFTSSVPIFAEVQGKLSHMFTLELVGACVEPSLAFSPPEVFLPVLPPGEEVMIAFSIVSYGYERSELSYAFSDDLKVLLTGVEKPGKRIDGSSFRRISSSADQSRANDSDNNAKMPYGNDIVARAHHHGSARVIFPEGRQLKGDGEPLLAILKFKAPMGQPTAFTTRIEFSTVETGSLQALNRQSRASSFLMLHGCTDNSLLTIWPYVDQQEARQQAAELSASRFKSSILERLRLLDNSTDKIVSK
jgi:hypothetical protein